MEVKGARVESRYVSLATMKFFSGLQTQRSPFQGIDTRYGTRFMGGKPDALIAGSNCEISNKLTIQRRPGLAAYGVSSIPSPLTFFNWQETTPFSLDLLVDTATAVYRYSTTFAGIWFNKATLAVQTNFLTLVNTVYMGDGVDLFKITGPNLLVQSNTLSNSVWAKANAPVTGGQTDPNGDTTAFSIAWATTGVLANIQQSVCPNVTPVPSNTFTFSVWLKIASGSQTVTLQLIDQSNTVVASLVQALTTTWTKYQITGTMSAGASTGGSPCPTVRVGSPTTTQATLMYGAQLEVGGPAKPTEITTIKAQGVYNWGIVAPTVKPTLAFSAFGSAWVASNVYALNATITDTNGNLQTVTTAGTSGTTQPAWPKTQATTTTDGTVVWTQGGPSGLSPVLGYQWYFAYSNSVTGHVSNVSPISDSSILFGKLIGQQATLTGARSTDPQVDQIIIYRNLDGGAFFFQVGTTSNPAAGSWTFVDSTIDSGLNTQIFAPIGSLNNPPPAGLVDPMFHAGRSWGHVGSILYYSAGADNAAGLNILFNGVSAESWPALNTIPFDAPITRKITTGAGLLVWTTSDLWIVIGSDLSTFSPLKLLIGHGIRSWNAMDIDGSTIYAYLSDREFVTINPNVGSLEVGFPVGDTLEASFDPSVVYVTRHVAGSQDNAVFFGDGSTGWFRINPHQVGASLSGEQTPLWSPFATIVGGCKALMTVETTPGAFQLLVGGTGTGPVLVRSLTTFTDNGSTYAWSATMGSIVLATAGQLAEVESISTEALIVQPGIAVLLDEISGAFETLSNSVNDPPQLAASTTLFSNRFYLSQGTVPPLCRHMQIKLSGAATATKDELLSLTIRGALVAEQQ